MTTFLRSGVGAYRERYGRPGTAAQLARLEVPPTHTVTYRGASFAGLDVTAVLGCRPELALADELARANLTGERHARRWQDVGELPASGAGVYMILNVAEIESLPASGWQQRLACHRWCVGTYPSPPVSGTWGNSPSGAGGGGAIEAITGEPRRLAPEMHGPRAPDIAAC